jgi:cysteine/O-acetylserine efflux protein
MNITSFLIYCFIVTFTPGPTNIVILSTVHSFGTKKAMEYTYGVNDCFWYITSYFCYVEYCPHRDNT